MQARRGLKLLRSRNLSLEPPLAPSGRGAASGRISLQRGRRRDETKSERGCCAIDQRRRATWGSGGPPPARRDETKSELLRRRSTPPGHAGARLTPARPTRRNEERARHRPRRSSHAVDRCRPATRGAGGRRRGHGGVSALAPLGPMNSTVGATCLRPGTKKRGYGLRLRSEGERVGLVPVEGALPQVVLNVGP